MRFFFAGASSTASIASFRAALVPFFFASRALRAASDSDGPASSAASSSSLSLSPLICSRRHEMDDA